jgi:uncharacterized protein
MNKVAVITGASSGIGFELAKVFAQNKYDLIINSSTERIETSARQLRELGVDVMPVEADLSTAEGVDALYERMRSLGRPIDVVALNAGIGVGGEFCETDYDRELELMNLNVVNLVYLTKKILPDMIRRNEGKLLFTSSIAGEMPGPYYAVYAASKAFIQSFAEALYYEMKDTKRNITVTSLQPGATDTEFFERADLEDTMVGEGSKDDPAKVAQQAYDALMSGKDHVVAGSLLNKLQVAGSKILPEKMQAAMHGREIKPKSMDQRH